MNTTAAPTATTTATIIALAAAGFEITPKPAYGQTYELWCRRADSRGCVLVVSTRGGRLVRASTWQAREREASVRGTASAIGATIRAFAADRGSAI